MRNSSKLSHSILFIVVSSFLIALLGVIIYSNTFHSPFVFDDYPAIVENLKIQNIDNIVEIYKFYPTRFLGFLSFALNYRIQDLDVFGYHCLNIAIHILMTLTVWWWLRITFTLIPSEGHENQKKWLAFLGAVIFLTHPIQTQSVTYIYQRVTSLAALFYLLSLTLYVKGRLSVYRKGSFVTSISFFVLSFLCAMGGIFSKEFIITLPFAIVAYELILLQSIAPTLSTKKGKIATFSTLGGLIFFVGIIPLFYKSNIQSWFTQVWASQSYPGDTFNIWQYFFTQIKVFLISIKLLFFPLEQNLDHTIKIATSLFDPSQMTGIVLIAFCGYLIVDWRKSKPLAAFGLLFFLITFSFNLIPRVNLFFEHRLYLPSVGFCLFIIGVIYHSQLYSKKVLVSLGIVIVTFSILTYQRNEIWHSPISLWTDVVEKSPDKGRGYHALGSAYLAEGQETLALQYFTMALDRDPHLIEAYLSRGEIYKNSNKFDLAMNDYNIALEKSTTFTKAFVYHDRGNLYYVLREFSRALEDYNESIKIQKDYADVYLNRGALFMNLKNYELAQKDFSKAIELNPRIPQAYSNRGALLLVQRKYEEALNDFNQALFINPDDAKVYNNRGSVYSLQGKYDLALKDFSQALDLRPDYIRAFMNRANTYRRIKEYRLANIDLTQALQINPSMADAYYKRSLNYKDQEDFRRAIEDARRARALGYSVNYSYLEGLEATKNLQKVIKKLEKEEALDTN